MTGRALIRRVDRPGLGQWATRAACRGVDPDPWFPPVLLGRPRAPRQRPDPYAAGRLVCHGCSVRTDCLAHALDAGEEQGMWGGLDPHERDRLNGRLAITQPNLFSAPKARRIQTIVVKGAVL